MWASEGIDSIKHWNLGYRSSKDEKTVCTGDVICVWGHMNGEWGMGEVC